MLYRETIASSSGSNRTFAYSTAPGFASVAAATFWLARWRMPTSASRTGVSVVHADELDGDLAVRAS